MLIAILPAAGQVPFALDPTFRAHFDNWYVNSIFPQPDGKVIIAGQIGFPGAEPLEYTGIARLNADGSWDPTFSYSQLGNGMITPWNDRFYIASNYVVRRVFLDGTNDSGYHLGTVQIPYFTPLQVGEYHVYPDGRILMGGSHQVNYPDSNWVGFYNLIWFTNTGYLDTTRAPHGGDGAVNWFEQLPDGKFICSGAMSQFDGHATSNIFRVHADGSLDTTFYTGANWGGTAAFLPLADGRCYAAGLFKEASGPDTLQLVRFMPDGGLDPSFNNHLRFGITPPLVNPWALGAPGSITQLDAGRLIIAGTFQDVDGLARGHICLVDTNGTLLDDYFASGGCGPHFYQGSAYAGIQDIMFTNDSMCYIWGEYHGYDDGTTDDPDQRFVTRLYGPDFATGAPERASEPTINLWPVPATGTLHVGPLGDVRTLAVTDLQGREVLRAPTMGRDEAVLSIGALAPGSYVLRALDPSTGTGRGGRVLGRFVKD
ncbi:MAG: delta-60 repeat domain-containing protein [Flavobacteriales bacterium]